MQEAKNHRFEDFEIQLLGCHNLGLIAFKEHCSISGRLMNYWT
jgi:hypothetical protein